MPCRTRFYLPHLELAGATYFVILRLAGTLPQTVLSSIKEERVNLSQIAARQGHEFSKVNSLRLKYLESKSIQEFLDQGTGDCFLRISEIAKCVRDALLHFDGTRYESHAFCIMPNHLHWILTPLHNSVNSP